ncbi:hypothetical protein AGOR_G00090140 [Albula goreensis]|uniref:Uncharacterized protein n=1 Tax=Albula goreensis TaxID=1534307 RepID=A0A8T3DJG6_9TELE|nr:hypothetical protein AGOR_G00090140 [Albula goreensis]
MRENIIPNAKKVKGRFLCDAGRAAVCSLYIERCWEIYQAVCRPSAPRHTDRTMTMRHLVWMMEDLGLYDDQLTVGKVLEILSAESPDPGTTACFNLDLEITFLEFFEALLGCAEVKRSSWVEKSKTLQRSSAEEKILKESEDSAENLKAEAEAGLPSARTEGHEGQAAQDSLTGSMSETERGVPHPPTASTPHPPTPHTDPAGHSRGGADSEMDQWVDAVHRFFSGTLFPAYERRALLHREAQEEGLRRAAADRIALAKAQRAARLRELCEEEEERREEEDEEEEDPHPSRSLAFPIPAASSTCVTNPTPPHSASGTGSRR